MASPAPERRETWKLAAVTIVWLALAKYLDRAGDLVPDAWKARMQLQTFLMICQLTAAAVGLGLSFALLAHPRVALAIARPRARDLAGTVLLAPAAFVASSYVAIQVALPTLLAELRDRGAGVSRENAGGFGRMLEQSPILATLLWSVVLAAVTEELLFRGALWSLVERVISHVAPPTGTRIRAAALGFVPTLVSALVFGYLHGDLQGGVGIVRVVSTTCLGLACGLGRRLTGTVFAAMAIHMVNNTLTLSQSRRWLTSSSPPVLEPIPNPIVGLAGACAAAFLVLGLVSVIARRRAERDRALALDDG